MYSSPTLTRLAESSHRETCVLFGIIYIISYWYVIRLDPAISIEREMGV